MKRFLLAFMALFFTLNISQAQAQTQAFGHQTSVWNIGLGIVDGAFPITASYEYGILGNLFDGKGTLGVGGQAGIAIGNNIVAYTVAPLAAIHYSFIPELDSYFKLSLGYQGDSISDKDLATSLNRNRIGWGAHIGTRYFFKPTVGMFGEIGYGSLTYLTLGVAFTL